MTNVLVAYRNKEDGAALSEYAVTFMVIVAVGTVGLTTVGTNLSNLFGAVANWVQTNITTLLTP